MKTRDMRKLDSFKIGFYYSPEKNMLLNAHFLGENKANGKDYKKVAKYVVIGSDHGGWVLDVDSQRYVTKEYIYLSEHLEVALKKLKAKNKKPINLKAVLSSPKYKMYMKFLKLGKVYG